MNQLQIFKNEEFGEVRSLLINNEPCRYINYSIKNLGRLTKYKTYSLVGY